MLAICDERYTDLDFFPGSRLIMSSGPVAHAPILSTSDHHILENVAPAVQAATMSTLSDEQLALTYEVERTVNEIRSHRWRRIALQFPDDMLMDGPRVYNRLQSRLAEERAKPLDKSLCDVTNDVSGKLAQTVLSEASEVHKTTDLQERLTILGDTSYGACCVDEVAAEHVNADVVVHYGRSCLSPTARLPVVHVFTDRYLNRNKLLEIFRQTYPDLSAKVVVMADIPFQRHVVPLVEAARQAGYIDICSTAVMHDPSSLLPNRIISEDMVGKLGNYSLFHIADPPSSLLLTVSSRVAAVHICPVDDQGTPTSVELVSRSTAQRLRRRFALVTQLSTAATFGILINTLSVKNYMSALEQIKSAITRAGKKYYTFVVGKLNAAKIANFAEIDGWVVIGCWESSLIESKDFWKPIITPFELELALKPESERYWTGEWKGDFQGLLYDIGHTSNGGAASTGTDIEPDHDADLDHASDDDSEPPIFDIRTGTYISTSRPMGRPTSDRKLLKDGESSSLSRRAIAGTLTAQIGGQVSPAADFLKSKRTWQGLGSDYEIAYEHDEEGKVMGATMQQGRSGLARGYAVGEEHRT